MRHLRTFKNAVDQIVAMCGGDEQLEDMVFYYWTLSHGERAVGECYEQVVRQPDASGNSGPSVQKFARHSEVF